MFSVALNTDYLRERARKHAGKLTEVGMYEFMHRSTSTMSSLKST